MSLKCLLFACFAITPCYCVTTNRATSATTFRSDYTYIDEHKAFYKGHRLQRNFSDAISVCKSEGSHLLLPRSAAEWDSLVEKIIPPDSYWFWIGAHDMFAENVFVTLNGTPIEKVYTNFDAGEPNDFDEGEDCLVIARWGTNNDVACDSLRYVVCRRLLEGLTINNDCQTYDPEYKYNDNLKRCYKFHTKPRTWRQAHKICSAENAKMVIINSQAEADYLVEELDAYSEDSLKRNFEKKYIHVGFDDLINHGTYLTIEGESLSGAGYEKWASLQPDNFQENKHCGSMNRNGELNVANCDNVRAIFVCEKKVTSNQRTRPGLPDDV